MDVLFFGKANDYHCSKALEFLQSHSDWVMDYLGDWGDKFPRLNCYNYDLVISYNSRWRIPAHVLAQAKHAINFHPGYYLQPGFAPASWALYRNEPAGVTAHYMDDKIDNGTIIKSVAVPILPSDNLTSLLDRVYNRQLSLFYELMEWYVCHRSLALGNGCHWERTNYRTRQDIDNLANIPIGCDPEEVKRRIRATSFKPWMPVIKMYDRDWRLVD